MFLKLLYTFSYSIKSIYNIKSSVARANRVSVCCVSNYIKNTDEELFSKNIMILLNIMHMLYVYYCISKTYLFMRKMNGHNTGHSTCQAYRVFQSPMEIVKCVGNQGVVRTALNSHAEREHVVRA